MLFEIHVARVVDPSTLLSDEITRDGKLKLITWDEARAAGYAKLPEPPAAMTVRYIAASGRDAKFLHHVFANNPDVMLMRTHEID